MWLDHLFQCPLETWSTGTSVVSREPRSQKALYAVRQCAGSVLRAVGSHWEVSCGTVARKLASQKDASGLCVEEGLQKSTWGHPGLLGGGCMSPGEKRGNGLH